MSHSLELQILNGIGVLGFLMCLVVMGRLRRVLARFDSSAPAKPASIESSVTKLGPYTLGDRIGAGAMGEVFRARHDMLQRWCAVKLLPRDVSERDVKRFEDEVRHTARLTHPNTVTIHDFGRTADGQFYYAMELLEGQSLQQLVQRHGPQKQERVVHILRQLCGALAEAHGKGLIHRDIKPGNVILCRQGGVGDVAKLLDFGLVKQLGEKHEASESINLLVGTPLYMSPEAIGAPQAVTAKSDLYALGAVAYFLLTGKPVFDGDSVVEVCCHHLHSEPSLPSYEVDAPIAPELERIVLDCLAKNPLARPQSAAELAARLERCLDDQVDCSETSGARSGTRARLEQTLACA
jgi:serine/threonine-protein kinase